MQIIVVVKAGDGVNGDITTGLVPYSKTNSIAYGIMPLNGIRPEITTNYTNSKAVSFELNSFWYGCVVGKVTDIVSAPADCKISVKGYDRSGKRVGFQQFTYTPFNSDMVTEMQQARLDIHFVGLARVIFSTTYESVRHLGVTLFDNMEYIVTAKI